MKFEVNSIYNGFQLINESELKDISSIGREFVHLKSGAKLVSIENEDDNKVFSISFKTIPEDSTGVFHILEHSVLCGSRKFPCKEPFVELAKGSLNTYLNAATYPDKTMYPVASRNKKDFRNLMDVYLDAVFYPNIYKFPEILKQEGWHYEINKPEEEITYKGVVYNEMQGVYSSPESILFRGINRNLLPDTCYGNDSGGDPDFIINLTQEAFIKHHQKFYHPSNSYIYLYGDMDILEELKFIDENYLNTFEKSDEIIEISKQTKLIQFKEVVDYYSISKDEDEKDKTYLSLNFLTGEVTNREHFIAFDLLEDILLETSASPLKKALIEAGIGKDAFGMYNNSILQTSVSIIVKGSNEEEKEKFKKVVFDTLKELVNKGIDKELIEAVLNIKEFDLKEADYSSYPKGLAYTSKVFGSWLYGQEPFEHLQFNEVIKQIREKAKGNYFEKLIEEYLLNNKHSLMYIVKPKIGLAEERNAKIREKLRDYKKNLSGEELENLVKENEQLIIRQSSEDSVEDVNKIPLLTLEDVNKKVESYNTVIDSVDNYNVLVTSLATNGIDYISFYFDSTVVKQEHIHYIPLLSYILGKVQTENYSFEELSNEIYVNTGGIDFETETYANFLKKDNYSPKFIVKGRALHEKSDVLLKLIFEIINKSKFTNEKRIRELFSELKSRIEMSLISSGHKVVTSRVASYFSEMGKYTEEVSGFSFYKFIADLDKNYESEADNIIKNLEEVYNTVFNRKNLIVSIGTNEESKEELVTSIKENISKNIKNANVSIANYSFKLSKDNEALSSSSKVQYVAKGYDFSQIGFEYSGKLQVLRTIANYNYLWNNIRVKGGAYGVFATFRRNGHFVISSYRDPNLVETLNCYDDFYKYLENFKAEEREMTKYILGTISNLDIPLTNSMICDKETSLFINNMDKEVLQKEREEILSAKAEDIRKFAKLVKACMEKNYICVLGSSEKINENSDLFAKVINVFE